MKYVECANAGRRKEHGIISIQGQEWEEDQGGDGKVIPMMV
jgi:hypothetical protein